MALQPFGQVVGGLNPVWQMETIHWRMMSREFYKGIHAPLSNQRKQRNNECEEQKQVVDSDSLCKS
jgi:hypothetical protein